MRQDTTGDGKINPTGANGEGNITGFFLFKTRLLVCSVPICLFMDG